MTLEERIEQLERKFNKMHADYELLNCYIPKLCDTLIRYWQLQGKYIYELEILRQFFKHEDQRTHKELQEHFQSHTNKKRSYISKY